LTDSQATPQAELLAGSQALEEQTASQEQAVEVAVSFVELLTGKPE
jgi:hypothetical protein